MSDGFSPTVIPPLSVVKVRSGDSAWADQKGKVFRIGYYSQQDGLDCVWLVDDAGEYGQTTDQQSIATDFAILKLSDEEDLFGVNRPVIEPRDSSTLH